MFVTEVVKCSGTDHKLKCLDEAVEAVRRAKFGNEKRNGQKVTIRGAITDPCGCHVDALIWLASDMVWMVGNEELMLSRATHTLFARHVNGEMR